MKHCLKVLICLTAATCATAALAQTEVKQAASASSPVAYVYVSGGTGIYAFATASNGQLTKVPGSPFAGSTVSSTINQTHLYAAGDDGVHIYSYAIADNGSLTQSAVINAAKYYPYNCGETGNLQSDRTGATVYNQVLSVDCGVQTFIQAFKVEDKGELQYEGLTKVGIPTYQEDLTLRFAAGNKFAYQTGCADQTGGGVKSLTQRFQRESNGLLIANGYDDVMPKAKDPGFVYCSQDLAADKDGNLALGFLEYNENEAGVVGPLVLASYKVSEQGQLSTESTYANMPATAVNYLFEMSISPAANLLAVGGLGFQLFHFNGSSPVTPYSGLLQPGVAVDQFWWDRANHLYILGNSKLYVYTVTPTSIQQAPGSPYSFYEGFAVSVLPLT